MLIPGNPVTLLWMSVVSGYLVQAVGYRWMFITEGLPAIAWAFVFCALVADRPDDAVWLSADERDDIDSTLYREQQELPEPSGFWTVARSRNVLVLSMQYFLWSVGVYGLVFWLPSIVKALTGRGIASTGVLSAVPYAAAVIAMLVISTVSDRLSRRRLFIWLPLLFAAGCFAASYSVHGGTFVVSYVLLIIAAAGMYAPYGPYFAMIPELLPAADAAPAIGMINGIGGLGGFVGTYLVGALGGANSAAPFIFLAACLFGAALLMLVLRRHAAVAGAGAVAVGHRRLARPTPRHT